MANNGNAETTLTTGVIISNYTPPSCTHNSQWDYCLYSASDFAHTVYCGTHGDSEQANSVFRDSFSGCCSGTGGCYSGSCSSPTPSYSKTCTYGS